MAGKISSEIWLDFVPKTGSAGLDAAEAAIALETGFNDGVVVDTIGGGITFLGAGSIKGGKTAYDVGQGFWLGADGEDPLYYKVAIGDPSGDTFNWDGAEINSKMNNLELRGWLRGPAEFVIDPAAHGDATGEVVIAGNMEIEGTTLQVPSSFTIDPATHGDNTGTLIIAGNLQVDGTTTTINSTVVEIDDIAIQLAAEATTSSLANNGGILVGTFTNYPSILYSSSYDSWEANKDWTPSTNNSKDLGNTSKKWRNLYLSGNADIDGSLTVDGGTNLKGDIILGDQTSDTIYINAEIAGHLIPDVTNTGDLGSSTKRWRKLYANNGDFSGNLDADGNATIGGTLSSTGNISAPNMADDLSATVSGSNININLLSTNNSVLGNVVLAPGSNISLSESNDIITIASSSVQSNWNETNSSAESFIQNKPTIPPAPVQSNWNETSTSSLAFIQNKPYLPDDLDANLNGTTNNIDIRLINSNSQILGTVSLDAGNNITLSESNDVITISSTSQVNSDWNATSGAAQILNKPTIPAAQVKSDWNATSGVAQILNKPTIPAAQVNSDWNATSGVAQILNKPTLTTTLSSLTDTTISSIQDGDLLKYNSTTSKWENIRNSVVSYSASPSPCAHYYIDIVEQGDVVTLNAALHISQETASTSDWSSTIQAPSGGSVPLPARTVTIGTALTTGSGASAYRTYIAQLNQSGVIKLIEPGSTTGFATVNEVKAGGANFLFINITYIQ